MTEVLHGLLDRDLAALAHYCPNCTSPVSLDVSKFTQRTNILQPSHTARVALMALTFQWSWDRARQRSQHVVRRIR